MKQIHNDICIGEKKEKNNVQHGKGWKGGVRSYRYKEYHRESSETAISEREAMDRKCDLSVCQSVIQPVDGLHECFTNQCTVERTISACDGPRPNWLPPLLLLVERCPDRCKAPRTPCPRPPVGNGCVLLASRYI